MRALPPLFDANGSFGCSATELPDLRTASEFLAHRDSLGVARALVWHRQARDLNPTWGNRILRAEIENTADGAGRLAPAFTIAASMWYERGAMDELRAAMASGRVRALRVFPGTLRHSLREVEPVMEAVLPFKPVLFLDSHEAFQPVDLLSLAETFPQVPMVYMQGMWPQLPSMLDLLRRRKNILVETSWIHTRGTIELICREFGANRILFGMGPKAHGGASIAALADAEIDEQSRRLIAHQNLEQLLGLPPLDAAARLPARHDKGLLWDTLLSGKPLAVEVVDAHGHLGPLGLWVVGDGELKEQADDALRRMDKIGIRTMIVSGTHALFGEPVAGNRLLEQVLRPYGDRFRGYLAFNPIYHDALTPTFEDFFSRGFFVGFKILCSYWRVAATDPRFEPMWAYAHEHRLPILTHSWDGPWDTPSLFKDQVKKHPEALLLLGHSGGGTGGRREAEELAQQHPNVVLEWCGSFTTPLPFEDTLQRVGKERVVFGTDGVLHSFAWELGRFLSLNLPDEVLTPILGGNIRGILSRRR